MIRSSRSTASVRAVLSGLAALGLVAAAQVSQAANRVVVGASSVRFEWQPSTGSPDGYLVSRSYNGGPMQAYAWVTQTRVDVGVATGDQITISVSAGARDSSGALRLGPASPQSDRVWVVPSPKFNVQGAWLMQCGSCPALALHSLADASVVLDQVTALPAPWRVVGRAQLDWGGEAIVWYNASTGQMTAWDAEYLAQIPGASGMVGQVRSVGPADFDRDGIEEFLVQTTTTNQVQVLGLTGNGIALVGTLTGPPNGILRAAEDFTGDGTVDLLWHDPVSGALDLWSVVADPKTHSGPAVYGQKVTVIDAGIGAARIASTGDYDGDGQLDLLVRRNDNRIGVAYLIAGRLRRFVLMPLDEADANRRVVDSVDLTNDSPGEEIILQDNVSKAVTMLVPAPASGVSRVRLLNPLPDWDVIGGDY